MLTNVPPDMIVFSHEENSAGEKKRGGGVEEQKKITTLVAMYAKLRKGARDGGMMKKVGGRGRGGKEEGEEGGGAETCNRRTGVLYMLYMLYIRDDYYLGGCNDDTCMKPGENRGEKGESGKKQKEGFTHEKKPKNQNDPTPMLSIYRLFDWACRR